jgi:hypothetical protein
MQGKDVILILPLFIFMNRFLLIVFILAVSTLNLLAQDTPTSKSEKPTVQVATNVVVSPFDIAKATLAAHGGDKVKNIKTLVMKGSLEMNVFNQITPAAFSVAISGEKYSFEINNPIQPMKQVFDGSRTYSTIPGFQLPPVTSLGFPLLPKVGVDGYAITELTDVKKKRKGFRITTPDGFYTDFYVDEKTSQIKGYESSYIVNERSVTTSVEIDEFQTVDGVVVPKKYSQRFDLGNITAYANFKSKDIFVNATIDDKVFSVLK